LLPSIATTVLPSTTTHSNNKNQSKESVMEEFNLLEECALVTVFLLCQLLREDRDGRKKIHGGHQEQSL
jgi:hypothetical protein